MSTTYHRRHFGATKLYCGVDKHGKAAGHVMAYNKKEAIKELREKGFKPVKVYQS